MVTDLPRAEERFLGLLRPIERDLESYARRMVWRAEDAPDALQNAVLRAYRAFDRYRDDASFKAWMFKILTNEIFTINRRHGRVAKFEVQVEDSKLDTLGALQQATEYTDWLTSPDALADALDENILAALKDLSEVERAVLMLRAIGDFRYREIRDALGIPMGSVMGHLHRARHKMRDALRPRKTEVRTT
jgi:RNA polymerase sigma-70 factor (ECF subfamily)